MELEVALRATLIADGTVQAAVGTSIFPLIIPERVAHKALTYQRVSCPRDYTNDGPTGGRARIAVTSWSGAVQKAAVTTAYTEVKALAKAVRQCLSGARATWDSAVVVQRCFLIDELDVLDEFSDAQELQFFGVRQIYEIAYKE